MTRSQRLQRWAELLEREPGRCLGTMHGTEYQPSETRAAMRSIGSPLSVEAGPSSLVGRWGWGICLDQLPAGVECIGALAAEAPDRAHVGVAILTRVCALN